AIVRYTYDADGNVATLAPPGRSDYSFTYSSRDEVASYAAPAVDTLTARTTYTQDADLRPLRTDLPNGQTIQFQYDASGRLSGVDADTATRTFGYDTAGRLTSLATTSGENLGFAYDGGLPTG